MSSRGLPLAPPGFVKSHQSSVGNFSAAPELEQKRHSNRSATPNSGMTAGGGQRKPTSGKFFGKNVASSTITHANNRTLSLRQLRDLINDIYS